MPDNYNYIQGVLDSIYAPAFVDFTVDKMALNLDITDSLGVVNTTKTWINNANTSDHMSFTYQEKQVRKALKKLDAYDSDKYYLFFFDTGKRTDLNGYMVFKSHFGFIFKLNQNPDEIARSIAHEIAHGAFRLRHTFSDKNKYIQTEGSTTNLMDYVDASRAQSCRRLLKYQWDFIHDPESITVSDEEEEEGEIVSESCFEDNSNYLKYISIKNKLLNNNNDYKIIYNYINNYPFVTYCISEFSTKEKEDTKKGVLGFTTNISKMPKMIVSHKTTNGIVINNVCMFDYMGDINFSQDNNQQGYTEFNIFHEFCHAAQHLYYGEKKFNKKLFEIEDRVIYLFSLYKKAGSKIVHDREVFQKYVISIIGENSTANYPFLYSNEDLKLENGGFKFKFNGTFFHNGFDLIIEYFDAKQNNQINLNNENITHIKNEFNDLLEIWAQYLVTYGNYTFPESYDWNKGLQFFLNYESFKY